MSVKWLVIALGLLCAREARAFPTGLQFDADALLKDGGGGIAFDGSPRFTSHTCAVCHTDPPGIISIRLEADDQTLFTDGWKPGQQYHMRVVMLNEWADVQYQSAGDNCGFSVTPYTPCDDNGFALEMDDLTGKPTGSYVPVVTGACANSGTIPLDVDIRVLTDGTAVTHNGAHSGMTTWDLCWTAPAAGVGVITAYVTEVDGNGGDGTINFPNNTTGDDVAAGAVPMLEVGGAPLQPQMGGCDASGDADLGAIAIIVAMLVVRRRRRALAAIVVIAASCQHVRPRERETLAHQNMKFGADPIEDELDLHMQEAREGSSGGYGSSGGGCGCN